MTELIGPWLADHEFFAQTMPILDGPARALHGVPADRLEPPSLPLAPRASGARAGRAGRDPARRLSAIGALLRPRLRRVRGPPAGGWDSWTPRSSCSTAITTAFSAIRPSSVASSASRPGDEYRTLQVRKKVPLMIRLPHGEKAGVRTVTGGHLDIAPTVLSLLGIRHESGLMLGRDLTQGTELPRGVPGRQLHGRDDLVRPPRRADGRHVLRGQDRAPRRLRRRPRTQRREARARLEVSDLVVRGDLVPSLHASGVGRGDNRVARRGVRTLTK